MSHNRTPKPGTTIPARNSTILAEGIITGYAACNSITTVAGFRSALDADNESTDSVLGCDCPIIDSFAFSASVSTTEDTPKRYLTEVDGMPIDKVKEELTDIFCEVFPLLDWETLVGFVDHHPFLVRFQLNKDGLLERLCMALDGKLTHEERELVMSEMRTNWLNFDAKHRPRTTNTRPDPNRTVPSEDRLIEVG